MWKARVARSLGRAADRAARCERPPSRAGQGRARGGERRANERSKAPEHRLTLSDARGYGVSPCGRLLRWRAPISRPVARHLPWCPPDARIRQPSARHRAGDHQFL